MSQSDKQGEDIQTPRTDAAMEAFHKTRLTGSPRPPSGWEFARQLERELARSSSAVQLPDTMPETPDKFLEGWGGNGLPPTFHAYAWRLWNALRKEIAARRFPNVPNNEVKALAVPESAPNAADDMEALRRKLETTDASQVSAEITRSASTDVLREIRIELAALVADPSNPDWMPALTNGNPADADCLTRAYELTRSATPATVGDTSTRAKV